MIVDGERSGWNLKRTLVSRQNRWRGDKAQLKGMEAHTWCHNPFRKIVWYCSELSLKLRKWRFIENSFMRIGSNHLQIDDQAINSNISLFQKKDDPLRKTAWKPYNSLDRKWRLKEISSPEIHRKVRNCSNCEQRTAEWDLIEAYKRTVNHLPHQLQLFPS